MSSLKIATGLVGTTDIPTNGVTASDIATNAVGSSEIATDAVGADEIGTGAVGSSEILDGQIMSLDIQDNGITAADLGVSSVGAFQLQENSVFPSHIAMNAVGASEIDGVTLLGFGSCNFDPDPICGTDQSGSNQGRAVVLTTCPITSGAQRVIAYPNASLGNGLVPCGSFNSGGSLVVCIQNVFDNTSVDGGLRTWSDSIYCWLAPKLNEGLEQLC